jgi:hypothetical protein
MQRVPPYDSIVLFSKRSNRYARSEPPVPSYARLRRPAVRDARAVLGEGMSITIDFVGGDARRMHAVTRSMQPQPPQAVVKSLGALCSECAPWTSRRSLAGDKGTFARTGSAVVESRELGFTLLASLRGNDDAKGRKSG